MRIEICGGIAAGKSTLAARIAEAGHFRLIKESYRSIPFWKKFYTDTKGYALEKNISFLLAHADAIPESSDPNADPVVCDYAMFQDMAYAELGPREDLATLRPLYARLIRRLPPPTIIINLSCSTKTQIDRILRRGRSAEQAIPESYLLDLRARIDKALHEYARKTGAQLIEYDTDEMNFASDPGAADAVRARLRKSFSRA
jgi:deoxyadenosine/deoxycytidine kinase